MGHGKIRTDKTCLNCNHVVENKYCPNCGQENTETRQSFHYLFTHFIEDLTHYDGSFWKTIKALLFRPGRLTKEYLEGKRKKYVPPVKLYIFISFVAFLLPAILPEYSFFGRPIEIKKEENKNIIEGVSVNGKQKINTLQELDSVQNSLPDNKKLSWIEYHLYEFLIKNKGKANSSEGQDKIIDNLAHNFPKVLFIYMPLFAFFLWLIHNKRKWYYFDSGVFTLHYFSFLLLLFTLNVIFNWFLELFYYVDVISILIALASFCYAFFYFFRAHSSFFGEQKYISRIKSLFLFFINIIMMCIFMLSLIVYTVYSTH